MKIHELKLNKLQTTIISIMRGSGDSNHKFYVKSHQYTNGVKLDVTKIIFKPTNITHNKICFVGEWMSMRQVKHPRGLVMRWIYNVMWSKTHV